MNGSSDVTRQHNHHVHHCFCPSTAAKVAALASVILVATPFFGGLELATASGCYIAAAVLGGGALLYLIYKQCKSTKQKSLCPIVKVSSEPTINGQVPKNGMAYVNHGNGQLTLYLRDNQNHIQQFPAVEVPKGLQINESDPIFNAPVLAGTNRYLIYKNEGEEKFMLLRQTPALYGRTELFTYRDELVSHAHDDQAFIRAISYRGIFEVTSPPQFCEVPKASAVYLNHGDGTLTLFVRNEEQQTLFTYPIFELQESEEVDQSNPVWNCNLKGTESEYLLFKRRGDLFTLTHTPRLIDKSKSALFAELPLSESISELSRNQVGRTVLNFAPTLRKL